METQQEKPKIYLPKRGRAEEALPNMKFIDLQRACIIRGAEFDFVMRGTIPLLQSFVVKNWENTIKAELLDKFDNARIKELKRIGKEGEPFVRLGFLGELENDIPQVREVKIKKPKVKRERNKELGIFGGTKKAKTFECVQKGYSLSKIIKVVRKYFPDVKEKSIKIWIRKAEKQFKNG